MLIVGVILVLIAGTSIPIHSVLFGRIVNHLVYHRTVSTQVNGSTSLSMGAQLWAASLNTTCSGLMETNPSLLLNLTSGSNTSLLLCDKEEQELFEAVQDYVCNPDSILQSQVGRLSLYYVALASGLLVSFFLSSVFLNLSAYRQARRIREAFFWSILRQDMGWFDSKEANGLNTQLSK